MATPIIKKEAQYYYLVKGNKSNELILIHRKNRHIVSTDIDDNTDDSNDRQLFHTQPIGYQYNNFTYLFNSEQGCVYMVDLSKSILSDYETNENDHITTRINIPYEWFFQCPPEFIQNVHFQNSLNRCEADYHDYHHPLIESNDWRWFLIIIIGCVVFLFVLIAIFMSIIVNKQQPQQKQEFIDNNKTHFSQLFSSVKYNFSESSEIKPNEKEIVKMHCTKSTSIIPMNISIHQTLPSSDGASTSSELIPLEMAKVKMESTPNKEKEEEGQQFTMSDMMG